jgi:hypothetical protein
MVGRDVAMRWDEYPCQIVSAPFAWRSMPDSPRCRRSLLRPAIDAGRILSNLHHRNQTEDDTKASNGRNWSG